MDAYHLSIAGREPLYYSTSALKTTLRMADAECQWNIASFKPRNYVIGEYMVSHEFAAGDGSLVWQLELYPRGHRDTVENFVSLRLRLVTGDYKLSNTKIKMAFLDSSNRRYFMQDIEERFVQGQDYGVDRFVLRDVLMKSPPLEAGALCVFCQVSTLIYEDDVKENLM